MDMADLDIGECRHGRMGMWTWQNETRENGNQLTTDGACFLVLMIASISNIPSERVKPKSASASSCSYIMHTFTRS